MIDGMPQRTMYGPIRRTKPTIVRSIARITERRYKIMKSTETVYLAHLFSIVLIFSYMAFASAPTVLSALIAASVWICRLSCLSVLPAFNAKYPNTGSRHVTAKAIDTNSTKIGHKARIPRQVQILLGTLSATEIAQIALHGITNGQWYHDLLSKPQFAHVSA